MLLNCVSGTPRSVTGRLNWSWHYLEEVDISVLLEPFAGLMKHWSIITFKKWFLWENDWNRKQWCFVDNNMEEMVPPWVVYLQESWLVLMIYRPWLQCEWSQASQIWQMAWQVTNTAGNLLACWAEADTFQSQTSLSSLLLNGGKKDAQKSQEPDCWWRTVSPKCLYLVITL